MNLQELNELADEWGSKQPTEATRKLAIAMLRRSNLEEYERNGIFAHEYSAQTVCANSRRYRKGRDAISVRTFWETLALFEVNGAVVVERDRRFAGRQLPNRYTMDIDKVAHDPEYEEWMKSLLDYPEPGEPGVVEWCGWEFIVKDNAHATSREVWEAFNRMPADKESYLSLMTDESKARWEEFTAPVLYYGLDPWTCSDEEFAYICQRWDDEHPYDKVRRANKS